MLAFQQYQLAFTAHIRDPKVHKKPAGVVPARMAVYREAVFNNIFESVSVCFPVCQKAIGKRAWRALLKEFVKSYPAQSPIFREIPQQFLQFLNAQQKQPTFLAALAHYEWVELAINAQLTDSVKISKTPDFLHEMPVFAPAHMLLEYDYPVHKISAKFRPTSMEKTYLLVFRNTDFKVKFIELNAVTFDLLKRIQSNHLPGEQVLASLAEALPALDSQIVLNFGLQTLQNLAAQQAIIGSVKV